MCGTPNKDLSVLIIDDSRAVRELLSAMLLDLGVRRVLEADSGAAALEQLGKTRQPVDVVFCDLAMPGLDGVQTLRGLAARHTDAGIALLSGLEPKLMGTVATMAQQMGLNVLGCLRKPWKQADVQIILESWRRLQRPAASHDVAITPEELDEAMHNDRLDVFYQPKIRMSDGKLQGVEALARLHHPAYGLIEPDAFIGVAEASGRITQLTLVVLEKAIQQAGLWAQANLDLGIAVNLSALAIRRLDLPDIIANLALDAALPNDRITLELTETQLGGGPEMLHIVSRFRLYDFGLAIDDYGTGQSSLKRLKHLPFTEIKIDKSFVQGAAHDEDLRCILESSISLGQRLRLEVVAEGVETRADWDVLTDLGCDMAQGFLAARPLPARELPFWIENWTGPSH